MLLNHGESLLQSAYAVLENTEPPSSAHGPGVLYLTTHRLVFESSVSSGRVRDFVRGREPRIVLEASLLSVRDARVRRGRLGKPRFVVDLGGSRPAFDVLDPDGWCSALAQAKRALPLPTPPGAPATYTIERQVVKVRCRFCGSLGNEVDGRCPSCGAPL
ncbi:MAG TPA: hypothetical protein VEH57_08005 [Thermoplasmata archaeon]|nr:hypothetical protein [Thermoplasmata archaeon]